MKKFTFFLALMFVTFSALAQITHMQGTVISQDDGEPIVGATVTVDGTKTKVVTNIDGKFTLTGLTAANKSITVTYVGCAPQTVKIAPDVTIKLLTQSHLMDEVVVTAFGKQKRESFTGSASVLKSEDIQLQQVNDPISALDGKVAGLSMIESNNPSDEASIIIRGIGSINAGTSPLIVVDGLPYSGYMRDINPADVDNISVLKDAASTALYGARAAGGVIMITTKNAKRGNTTVSLDMKWGANTDGLQDYDVIDNPGEYYEAHYLALRNYYMYGQGQSFSQAHANANNTLGKPSTQGGLDYMVYSVPANQFLIGTNGRLNPNATLGNRVAYNGNIYTLSPDRWRDYGIRTGFRQEYNLALSGGNERSSFYASLGYLGNEGISYGSKLDRYSARFKADYQAFSWLKVGGNATYTHTSSDAQNAAFSICHSIAPIYPLFVRDGMGRILTDSHGPRYDYGDGENGGIQRGIEKSGNSIQDDLLNENNMTNNSFNIQGFADFSFLKYFKLTVNGSVYNHEFRSKVATNPYYGYSKEGDKGTTSVAHYRNNETNFQQLLSFDKTWGQHNLNALIGHEYSRLSDTELFGNKSNIAMFGQNTELDGAIINGSLGSSSSMYNIEGFFARAQYDYASRYFASASLRRDGSSRFHPDHRWGNFWSLGAAWIINKESWFPKNPMINMLKVKMSYGEVGNDAIGNFRYTDYYYIDNSNDEVALVFSQKGNPDITWETTGSFNAGVEFEFFNNRLQGDIEYYRRKTTNMLQLFDVPTSLGYSSYYDNVGDMVNHGLEMELSGSVIRTKDIDWSLNMNLSWQNNEVTRLPDSRKQSKLGDAEGYVDGWNFVGEGLPMYTWRIPRYAGVNSAGKSLFYLEDGVSTTTEIANAAYVNCGSALPDVFGGFGTTLRLFGFDLSAQFNYSIGGKKLDTGYQGLMTPPSLGATGSNIHRDVFKSWSPENPTSDIPIWQYSDNSTAVTTDRFLTDASYLWFKNLNIGYSLPKKLLDKMHLQKFRVYFACDNIYYWSQRQGFDPRQSMLYSSEGGYSPMRTFMGGISIQY